MITIPLQLLSSAPDTEVLDLASKESLAKECGSSDFVNLRGSPRLILSVKWKRDSWNKFLFGRICSPSHTENFEDWWILRLRESLANRTALLESEAEEVTNDSSSTIGCVDLSKCNQEQSSLRMSKDSFLAKCQMELFASNGQSKDWKQWAINLRQEYSARRNAVRRIAGTESSSLLPTPCANEDSFRLNGSSQQSKTLEAMARRGELKTAATGSAKNVDRLSLEGANASMVNLNVINAKSGPIRSTTTQAMDVHNADQVGLCGPLSVPGPLNPLFVEVMMGLPIGWTDCASSETESSPQPLL
jgi:hypothetical protein